MFIVLHIAFYRLELLNLNGSRVYGNLTFTVTICSDAVSHLLSINSRDAQTKKTFAEWQLHSAKSN